MAQQTWTGVVAPGEIISAVHYDELMDAVNAWESAYGIPLTSWTQDEPSTLMEIKAATLDEIQVAVTNLETLAGAAVPNVMTNRSPGDLIFAADINDLRVNMNHLQANACYQCHTCDNYSGCSCDQTCHGYAGCSCNNTCHGHSGCSSCNYSCYGQPSGCTCNYSCYDFSHAICGTCDNMCHGYSSCSCNNTCYGHSGCSCNNTCYSHASCSCNATCYQFSCTKCDAVNHEYPWS